METENNRETKPEAGRAKIPVKRLVMPWTDVGSELPPQCRKVIVTYKNSLGNRRIVLAERYAPLTVECNCEYDCDCDYDEKRGCHYMPEGWWEIAENHEEFQLMLIGEKITHWMFLPECP